MTVNQPEYLPTREKDPAVNWEIFTIEDFSYWQIIDVICAACSNASARLLMSSMLHVVMHWPSSFICRLSERYHITLRSEFDLADPSRWTRSHIWWTVHYGYMDRSSRQYSYQPCRPLLSITWPFFVPVTGHDDVVIGYGQMAILCLQERCGNLVMVTMSPYQS